MRKCSVLVVAFDYPPYQASSGVLRTLALTRELLAMGWEVAVLTASHPSRVAIDSGNEALVPAGCRVIRARAFDAARDFSIFGKYPGFLELPDRYSSWIPGAYIAGLGYLRSHKPQFLYSTYPPASAHLVGWLLSKHSEAKWVADFRDPMILPGHPDTPARRRAHAWIEQKTMTHCDAAIFTSNGAEADYRARYRSRGKGRMFVVENGYDATLFDSACERAAIKREMTAGAEITLLHSGSLYPDHRDPCAFFAALAELRGNPAFSGKSWRVVLRACGYTNLYRRMIADEYPDIVDMVQFESSVDYIASITEMLAADGLLLFQGASCNHQIPAKLYEYARTLKPILAFVDPAGETSKCLRQLGVAEQADIASTDDSRRLLTRFFEVDEKLSRDRFIPTKDTSRLSREYRSRELAAAMLETLSE